jgi:ATP-binding cassette subfamily C protein
LISNLPKILFELVGVVTILIVFIFSYNFYYSGNTLELLGVFLFAFFKIVPSLNRIAGNYQTLRFSKPSLQLMINLNELENIKDNEKNYNDIKIIFVNNILLKFENFSYHYKNKDYILKNINLFINKNSKVGITGHSGSGKSTLLDILSGTIKLNGNPILVDGKIINGKSYNWRQILSYVPQKTFIIEDTLRNNVLFGINKDLIKDYLFNTILETVNLKKLITKLPNGIETVIKENGNNLSGGEVQRIGIARALLRKPQILLLDEVTSNLDLETEAKVIEDLLKIKNLTIISVSHRLASFKGFDVIYNLSGGSLNQIKN